MQYGYLPWSDMETGALRTDTELRRAIRQFQRVAGLRPTGRLDTQTLAFMQRPRCGMADIIDDGRWTVNIGGGGGGHRPEHLHHRVRHGRAEGRRDGGDNMYGSDTNGGGLDHHLWPSPQQYVFGPSKWNRTQLTFRSVVTLTSFTHIAREDGSHATDLTKSCQ